MILDCELCLFGGQQQPYHFTTWKEFEVHMKTAHGKIVTQDGAPTPKSPMSGQGPTSESSL